VLGNIQSGFSSYIAADLEALLFGGTVHTAGGNGAYAGDAHASVHWELPFERNALSATLAIRDGDWPCTGQRSVLAGMAMIDGDTFFLAREYARSISNAARTA